MRTYHFTDIGTCCLCGAPAPSARVLGMRLDRSQGRNRKRRTGLAVTVCRCRSCGFVFPNPEPRPKSFEDHYKIPVENYWTQDYFKPDPGYFSRQVENAKQLLDFKPGMTALDIGVGIGKAAQAMKMAGFEVFGIEPSEPFCEKAIERLGFDSVHLQMVSVEDAVFPDGKFDFATFGAVLEHLYDPALVIERTMRWLKPGGILHAEVLNSDHLISKIINLFYKFRGTNDVTNISPMHSPYHIHEFTLECFSVHGARAGYEIARHYVDVCAIMNIPSVLHPLLRWRMERAGTGMQLTVWLRKGAKSAKLSGQS